ncbi:MAG: DUF1573 domain-containing protein [Flavobacteriaceae bacterium]|nr:DUF1573 domain-containing protein [Flavobacteriaceae bacterium]
MIKIFALMFGGVFLAMACKELPSNKIKDKNLIAQSTIVESQQAINNQLIALQEPTLKFDKLVHDFGTIEEGETVETVFYITNIGETDLKILNAEGSCGCTVPEFPTNPIAPGKKDSIIVKFDSSGFSGNQQKTVTLHTNTANGEERVRIRATIQE